jgi:8-amino-7-oxononanoate synthase
MRNSSVFSKADYYDRVEIAKKLGIYPYFREISSEQDTEVILKENGSKAVMLGSNSYLGLTSHPEIKRSAIKAIEKYGTGCAGSPFLNGTLDIHKELEQELASFIGKEDVLLYPTGFMANLGVVSSLPGRRDILFMDQLNHASLIDASRQAYAKTIRFKHNDYENLEAKMKLFPNDKGKIIVTEGVFSMDGDIVKLDEIVKTAKKHNGVIILDDAHGIGVLGKTGAGTVEHFGLKDEVDIIVGTFSKSLATTGGFVASDYKTINYLRHHSRSLIFSASMTPSSAASALMALKILKREPERIVRLWENTERMKSGLIDMGFHVGNSETPILPVFIGKDEHAFFLCKQLENEGVFVNPVIFPAVPKDNALLRISLMSTHTSNQIDFALKKFKDTVSFIGVLNAVS